MVVRVEFAVVGAARRRAGRLGAVVRRWCAVGQSRRRVVRVFMVLGVRGPEWWRCGVRRALIVVSVEC